MAVSGDKTLGTRLAGTIQAACNVSTAKHIRGGKIILGLGGACQLMELEV